jgi:hypothetical protein
VFFEFLQYVNFVLDYFFAVLILSKLFFVKDFKCNLFSWKFVYSSEYSPIRSLAKFFFYIEMSFKLIYNAKLCKGTVEWNEVAFIVCWKGCWKRWIFKFKSVDFFPIHVMKTLLHWGKKKILIPNIFYFFEVNFCLIKEETSVMNLSRRIWVIKHASYKVWLMVWFCGNWPW